MNRRTIAILAVLLAGALTWILVATTFVDGARPERSEPRVEQEPGRELEAVTAPRSEPRAAVEPATEPADERVVEKEPTPVAEPAPRAGRAEARTEPHVLVGRLVGPDGAPFADGRLAFLLAARGSGRAAARSGSVQTDAGGRFVLDLPTGTFGSGMTGEVQFSVTERDDVELGAFVALPVPLFPGENDVGDLDLAPAPLLVAGRVVDASGRGVARARVQIQKRNEREDGGRPSWSDAGKAAFETDAEGRFEERGWLPAADYGLWVTGRGVLRTDPVPFSVGDPDVVVTVEVSAIVRGSVLLDEGVDETRLQALVISAPNATHMSPIVEGGFEIGSLEPGVHEFRIESMFGRQQAFTVPDLLVEPGLNEDPRLQEIDLRGKLGLIEIRITDLAGEPISTAKVEARVGHWGYSHSANGGSIELVTAGEPLELLIVRAPGYREVELREVAGDRVVRLEPGIEIVLRLPEGVAVPPEPFWVGGHLVHERTLPRLDVEDAVPFDADGQARFRLPRPGRYALRLVCGERPHRAGSQGKWIQLGEHIEVGESGNDVFTVSVTQARIDEALEGL